jgi:hypothetical protein
MLAHGIALAAGADDKGKPLFVPAGTKVDAALRAKAGDRPILAQPSGYSYFYTISTGTPTPVPGAPGGCPWQGCALRGWACNKSGTAAGYHIAVPPGGRFVVAVGFFGLGGKCHVVLDGKVVDTVGPAARPFVKKYQAADLNGDGFLQVACCHVVQEGDYTGSMNAVWVFSGIKLEDLDVERMAKGQYDVPPLYCIQSGREETLRGHVGYPALSAAARAKMLPMRPVRFELDPQWPQPADPLDIELRGELADRIHTYLDRWGFAGRDQRLVAGFLSDAGWEDVGRSIDTLYLLGRLMHCDFDLGVPAAAALATQEMASRVPGSFVGGRPTRTAFIWSQACVLSALMASHERTGDPKFLAAADKLAEWYDHYLNKEDLEAAAYLVADGRFTREGAMFGHIGKGALEGMTWLYWRTKNPKYLKIAQQIADLNRKHGGVSWMIHGDEAPSHAYEDFHIHTSLSTLRGFPWLYAATGDRSYLDDAITACDRVWQRTAWGTGGVPENIPWKKHTEPRDETCQTSDELQLSYLLGDFTGQGRFFDRAELIYYNHIRYMQMHNGDFTGFNLLPGTVRGGDFWFCCGWWGAKALYETARHVYASAPTTVYVNGFLPSAANLKLKQGSVRIETQADIPKSGDVSLKLTPQGVTKFPIKIRVPGWARLGEVQINNQRQAVQPDQGYVTLERNWNPDDKIDIHFELPLRVVLDSAYDSLPAAKVAVDGAPPVETRRVLVFRGPAILAQFTLAGGCNLSWAYTGDHPDLFDTVSAADVIEAANWNFKSNVAPALTTVSSATDGVRLAWEFHPQPGWTLKRSAIVRPGVPVRVEYAAELTAPSAEAAKTIKSVRLCGVRMRTGGFQDYAPARLLLGPEHQATDFAAVAGKVLTEPSLALDNGYVQFRLRAGAGGAVASSGSLAANIYLAPATDGLRSMASCTLEITGQSQFAAPIVSPDGR